MFIDHLPIAVIRKVPKSSYSGQIVRKSFGIFDLYGYDRDVQCRHGG